MSLKLGWDQNLFPELTWAWPTTYRMLWTAEALLSNRFLIISDSAPRLKLLVVVKDEWSGSWTILVYNKETIIEMLVSLRHISLYYSDDSNRFSEFFMIMAGDAFIEYLLVIYKYLESKELVGGDLWGGFKDTVAALGDAEIYKSKLNEFNLSYDFILESIINS